MKLIKRSGSIELNNKVYKYSYRLLDLETSYIIRKFTMDNKEVQLNDNIMKVFSIILTINNIEYAIQFSLNTDNYEIQNIKWCDEGQDYNNWKVVNTLIHILADQLIQDINNKEANLDDLY